jgi:glycosyltransferase involved in cell wall biosynthesis
MSSFSQENTPRASSVGAVVIGRNEGDRLRACLASVLPCASGTVYVDSGSSDGSVELATQMGAEAIELSTSIMFTAARARNVGWKRIVERNPSIEFVQFVDGDCTLTPEWIQAALAEFGNQPKAGVIFGHVRELEPKKNIYHRLAEMEWDTPPGVTKYCGGIAMYRAAALSQVNGFRDDLACGEEPELCVRLRQAGWSVVKLNHEMSRHDCDISTFGKWWKRTVRNGFAYAAGAALHGAPPEGHWVKETRSIWMWGVVLPILGLALAWPTHGISLLVIAAAYLLLLVKIVVIQVRGRRRTVGDAALYALACVVGKWPQAIGMIKYHWTRSAGLGAGRIELTERRCSSKDVP